MPPKKGIKVVVSPKKKMKQQQPAVKVVAIKKAVPKRSSRLPGGLVLPAGTFSSGGGIAGTAIGSMFGPMGAAAGGVIGRGLGSLAAKLAGTGDYTLSSNSLVAGTVPTFSEEGRMRFKFREYLGDISSIGATFNLAAYSINPGLAASFPQLSVMASLFRKYRFHGLVYEFKTASATAVSSTNTALGVVMMATEYDVQKSNFTTKQQMEDYNFASSTVPSCSVLHAVECKPNSQYPFYLLRNAGVPSGYDAHLYDLGRFQIATVGQQAASNIGELWVTYDVEFSEPVLPDSVVTGAGQRVVSTITAGTTLLTGAISTGASYVSYDTTKTFTFLVGGDYIVQLDCATSVATITGFAADAASTVTSTEGRDFSDGGGNNYWNIYVRATAGQTLIVNATTGGAATGSCYWRIMPFNYSLAVANH